MILAAVLCPILFSLTGDTVKDAVNGLVSEVTGTELSEEETDDNAEAAEKAQQQEDTLVLQKKWFKENKPTGKNPDNASDFTFMEYTYEDGIEIEGYMITEYTGSANEVVIPSEYEGKFVIALDFSAFEGQDITSVTLPESMLYIGGYVFKECKYLESINFPENLQKIAVSAFEGCKSLSTLNLGRNIKYIGESAFARCDLLKTVQITGGASPLTIGAYCFGECIALERVTIPDYTEKLENSVFSNCKALTDFVISDTGNYTNIETGRWVFEYCEGLKTFDASRFTKIDGGTFQGCTSLETVILPDMLEEIQIDAFLNCTGLKNITLPDSVSVIGEGAFAGCTSLTTINIPASLTKLGDAMLMDSGITEIFIPANVSDTGRSTFENCTNLKRIEFAEEGEKLTIDFCAFRNTGVEELVLPGRVVTAGNQSFVACANLKKVVYKSSGAVFADQNIDYCAFADSPVEEIHIPATVDSIHESAIPYTAVIYCPAGSSAEEWAKQYGVNYVTE